MLSILGEREQAHNRLTTVCVFSYDCVASIIAIKLYVVACEYIVIRLSVLYAYHRTPSGE